MSAQDRHNAPPAPGEREYETLTADAELGRKRGEWLTEAYARISELEVENRRLREVLEFEWRHNHSRYCEHHDHDPDFPCRWPRPEALDA